MDVVPNAIERRLMRADARFALAADQRGFREAVESAGRVSATGTTWLLRALAVVLLVAWVGLLGIGSWLVWSGPFGPRVLGVVMLVLGVLITPRLPRAPETRHEYDRSTAPALFGILDQVAAEMKAPAVQVISADDSFNAFVGRFGLRRRTRANLGLLLWGSLGPDARIALLGHELGHLVNRDPRGALFEGYPIHVFSQLATVTKADGSVLDALFSLRLVEVVQLLVFKPLHAISRAAAIGAAACALRESQRAEYRADEVAFQLGGSAGYQELTRVLVGASAALTAVQRAAASTSEPMQWRAAVTQRLREAGPDTIKRQTSIRQEASIFSSHPPAGYRAMLADSLPLQGAQIAVSDARWAAADQELAAAFATSARSILRAPTPT